MPHFFWYDFRGNASAYIKPEKFGSGDAAECSSEDIPDECLLGIVPHTIRGFLSTFSNVLPATPKYNQCIACSDNILKEFATNGFEFLLKVFNSAKILEDITGLTELQKLTDCDAVSLHKNLQIQTTARISETQAKTSIFCIFYIKGFQKFNFLPMRKF